MTWTWWMTLLAIFAALVLIGCIPVGVDARYNAEGVFLAAKLGPIRLQLLPQKPKKKKKQQKKPEKAPEKAASQEKKPNPILSGGVDEILQLLDIVLDTLGDLRRKLRVNELTLYVRIPFIFPTIPPACWLLDVISPLFSHFSIVPST